MTLQEIEKMERANQGSSMLKMLHDVAATQPMIKTVLNIKSGVDQLKKSPHLKVMTNTEKLDFQVKLREGIKQDITDVMLRVKNQHIKTIEKAQADYQTYRKTHVDQVNLQVQDDVLKFGAMSAEELNKVSLDIIAGKKDFSPEAVDVISRELKQTDPNQFKLVREKIAEHHYHEPHLRTEEGRKATEAIKQIDTSIRSGLSVPYQDPKSGNYAGINVIEAIGGLE